MIVVVVMGTILAIAWKTIDKYAAATDVAAVLGVLVPALAGFGAAAFGIPLAFNAGQRGKEEAKDAAKKDGKIEAAQRIKALIKDAGGLAAMGATDSSRLDDEIDTILAGS
ncbi:MAG: hypothetical protein ACXV98_10395 [Ilumatobacteraceae bacterium]